MNRRCWQITTGIFQLNKEILRKNTAPGNSDEAAIVVPTVHDYCPGNSSRWSAVLLITDGSIGLCFPAKNNKCIVEQFVVNYVL